MNGRRNTSKINGDRRRKAVEEAIRKHGWSEALVARLMEELGVVRSVIYEDRNIVLAKLAKEEAAGLDERRASFLLDLRRVKRRALKDGSYSPVARLMDMEQKILGLDRVPLPEVADDPNEPLDLSLEGVLRETRRMRKQAQAGHTYTAADRLLEREQALIEAIRQRDEAEAARNLQHMDEAEKVALVTELLGSLPDTIRRQVLDAVRP